MIGRRDDGYHLLDSIFAAIDFADRVTVSTTRVHAAESRITVTCRYPGVPSDATNLAARAARALLDECGVGADIDVTLEKRIPPGAGLGGGSSNAASVLRAVNAALELEVPARRLAEIALGLGADVPFFLTGGCARVRGIGEHVEPVGGWPGYELVLALPGVAVSTAWAFGAYMAGFHADATEPARLAASADLDPALLRNDLEAVVLPAHSAIAGVKQGLLAAGAAAAVMSGSGAAVVAVGSPATPAREVADGFRARQGDVPVHVVRILGPDPPLIG